MGGPEEDLGSTVLIAIVANTLVRCAFRHSRGLTLPRGRVPRSRRIGAWGLPRDSATVGSRSVRSDFNVYLRIVFDRISYCEREFSDDDADESENRELEESELAYRPQPRQCEPR